MNPLKFRNNHSKGRSKYQITATMDDGSEQTHAPVGWQPITGRRHDAISKAYITEMKDRANGLPHRNMRGVVGLEPLIRRPYRPVRKKPTKEHLVLMNRFTLGKAL